MHPDGHPQREAVLPNHSHNVSKDLAVEHSLPQLFGKFACYTKNVPCYQTLTFKHQRECYVSIEIIWLNC